MNENQAYVANERKVISETLEGETIIINLENGNYYSLNKTGSEVWDRIIVRQPAEAVVKYFIGRYDASEDEITASIGAFITFLKNDNLIMKSGEPAAAGQETAAGAKEAFVAPEIKRYEDMQEMLLADPIHDVDEIGWPARKKEEPTV